MTVKVTGEGMLSILEAVAELSRVEVLVGVPHGEARTDERWYDQCSNWLSIGNRLTRNEP